MGNNATLVKKKKKAFMGIWECHDLGKLKEFQNYTRSESVPDQGPRSLRYDKCHNSKHASAAHTSNPDPTLQTQYQAIIGLLLYLMLGTHPDIAFAVIKLSQFSANPSKEHYEWAKYICCYLAGTKDYIMVFDGNTNEGLIAHSDIHNHRSITGYFLKLARSLVSWLSRAQKTVALSSTKAEYMAISDCC